LLTFFQSPASEYKITGARSLIRYPLFTKRTTDQTPWTREPNNTTTHNHKIGTHAREFRKLV